MSLARKIASLFGASGLIDPSLYSSLPTGVMVPHPGNAAPDGYVFCFGQPLSRTTYAALYAALGGASSPHGQGDGSTTFNVPDMRGRVPAGKDDMGGTAANRLTVTLTGTRSSTANGNITGLSSTAGLAIGMRAFGTGIGANAVITAITSATAITLSVNSTSTGSGSIRFGVVDGATLGAVGGSHVHGLLIEQMPQHDHTYTNLGDSGGSSYAPGGEQSASGAYTTGSSGGGQAHPNVQPTLITNYIIKT